MDNAIILKNNETTVLQNAFKHIANNAASHFESWSYGAETAQSKKKDHKKYILAFDLDNTLVKTDRANNNAYQEAIRSVTGREMSLGHSRFTRGKLAKTLPDLDTTQLSEIVKLKERLYSSHLKETILNAQLFKILKLSSCFGFESILLTESHRSRAIQICKHHSLTQYFSKLYCRENYGEGNKYQFLKTITLSYSGVILFENEKKEINKAIRHGINENQLITIKF
ncbi:MAG: HAD hydrolase-like protein [Bacteroidales bacterium]|nr:HAD hydrolase-like protein [Bacteroidales bacterium]